MVKTDELLLLVRMAENVLQELREYGIEHYDVALRSDIMHIRTYVHEFEELYREQCGLYRDRYSRLEPLNNK